MALKQSQGSLNPNEQDISPGYYLHLSNSPDVPTPPSGLAMALKGAGEMLDLTVKGVDSMIKTSYQRDVQNQVNPEKDQWVEALEKGKTAVSAANAPKTTVTDGGPIYGNSSEIPSDQVPTAGNEPMSLAQAPASLPKDIQALPGRLKTLESARDSGNIDDLDFRGRVYQIAKDIRARYPTDYREDIDHYVDQVVKAGPANEYATALMHRINANLTNADKEYHAMLGEIRNNLKYPGMENTYDKLLNRQISISDAGRALANQKQIEYGLDLRRKATETFQGETKEVTERYGRLANEYAYGRVRSYIQGTVDSGDMSFPMLHDLVQRAQAGDPALKNLPSEWWAKMAASMDGMILKASAEMDEEFGRKDASGRASSAYMSAQDWATTKKAALTPLTMLKEAFTKEDMNLAGQSALWAKMATQDLNYKILNDKQIGGSYLMMTLLKQNGGDQAVNNFMMRSAQAGKLDEWDMFVKNQILQLATPDGDPRHSKDIKTLTDAFDKTNKALKENDISKQPKSFQELTSIIDAPKGISILSPDTPFETKRQLALKIFGPGNESLLQRIDPDMRDAQGKKIDGMESFFYRLTKPEFAKQMTQLGPDLKDMYEQWVTRTYEQDVAKVAMSKFRNINLSTEDKFEVAWDPKNKQFVVNKEGVDMNKPVTSFDAYKRFKGIANPQQLVEDAVQDMNKGLRGMKSVAENLGYTKSQVDMFMLKPLMEGGLAPEKMMSMPGIPADMANAIWTSYIASKQREVDLKKQQEEIKNAYTPKYK